MDPLQEYPVKCTRLLTIRKGESKEKKKEKKANRKIRKGQDEKEGEEEDEKEDGEDEGKIKDKKIICINPLEISPPLNFAPQLLRTPTQGGTWP